ncbi:MAG: nicotinamide mononucleotide transporter [Deltaproteobacteria bacterium]|nr:nicotinamide mononucleotide transporter [Deltaproteobacteria bacterium]
MEIIFKYHGIDWIAIIMTFLTLYYLGERRRFGFVFGIVASISWLIFGILVDSIANIIANVIFIALNLRGYLNWKEQN